MMAYVTLLSTSSYLPGVLALNESLKQTGTNHPMVVGISSHLSRDIQAQLVRAGMLIRIIDPSTAIPAELVHGNGHWGHTFDKIQLFDLTEFSKLVYVDSDMLILSNIDELFDKPHMAGVAAGRLVHPDWTRLNGGLMVIVPQAGLAGKIFATLPQALAESKASGGSAIGDQDLINAYYPGWSSSAELEVCQGYNVFQCHLDAYIENHGYCLPDKDPSNTERRVKIVHFIGPRKPWMNGAVIRQILRRFKKGKSVKWEHRVFVAYKKLLDQVGSAPLQQT